MVLLAKRRWAEIGARCDSVRTIYRVRFDSGTQQNRVVALRREITANRRIECHTSAFDPVFSG